MSPRKKTVSQPGKGRGTGRGTANNPNTAVSDSSLSSSPSSSSPSPTASPGPPTMRPDRIPVRSPSMRRDRKVLAEEKGPKKAGKVSPQKKRKAKKQADSDHDSADDAAQDGISLANTRIENFHARGGRLYDTDQEPLTANFNATSYQRLRRRLTLRNRINPHPVTSEEVETHLTAAGWDVDRAYQRWHAQYMEAMEAIAAIGRRDLPPPRFNVRVGPADENSNVVDGEGFLDNEDYIPYPFDGSSERERRQLVTFLRDLVEDARDLEGSISLRRSEAIMLLREAGWDVIQARDLYLEHQYAFEEVFNSYRHFRGPTQLRSERDDRLSRLIDMTGRRDIDSLDAHLRRHNYNFISAVVAWQKSGIPAINIVERPEVDPIVDDAVWESENESDVEEEDEEDEQENDVVKHVTTINTDRISANKGVPDHTKMMVEYIRNGKYSARIFRHRSYRWSDEDPEDRPEFDWNRQEDVNILNSWRREIFGRIDGTVTQPRNIPWLEIEDDFIYELHRERWDELIAAQPNVDPQSLLPLEVRAPRQREWAQRFNARFEGNTYEGSDDPRPNRSFGAINIRRHRIQRVINDFGLEPNEPHPKGDERKAGGKRKRTKHSAELKTPTQGRRDEVDKDRDENEDDDREDLSGDEHGAGTPGSGKKKQAKVSRRKPAQKKPKKDKGNKGRDG